MKKIPLLLALLPLTVLLARQPEQLASGKWPARWIDVPNTDPQGYGVYHFRRSVDLPSIPAELNVYVSGDNRYELYANGLLVSRGPARGDLSHWRYETVNLTPHLHPGKNVLAAVVWNDGQYRAVAQISSRTGFLLQAERAAYASLNTGKSWLCSVDKAYSPRPLPADQQTGYYALAANENFEARAYPWGWETPDFNDSAWTAAHELSVGSSRDARDAPNRWMLVPREIPPEEQTTEPPAKLRKAEGAEADQFPGKPAVIPAHRKASLLLDQGYLTTAYPSITVSGGADGRVDLRYAETLYLHKGSHGEAINKGNRNDVDGKLFYGASDHYVADGGEHRTYRPLFWRTYRYLKLEVETGDQPLRLEKVQSVFTGYPFQKQAEFSLHDRDANADVQRILATGWRTARLCAHETYMDCPYYEQLQYGGDARIQMMVSLYMTGDARLMKNGISLLNSSRTAEGATFSRAPSALQQYIPPFSLWWIGMVHDYWMYVDDPGFVKQMMPGVRAVLSFYAGYQKPSGSLHRMPWWNFVDWVKQWPAGEPPGEADGSGAAALDLQLLLAYRWAADLEAAFGSKALSEEYKDSAERLREGILATDWDGGRGLFADQPSHTSYSQHVNTLAILAGLGSAGQRRSVMEKIMSDASLAQSSIYFRAYTNAALRETGLGDRYLDTLGPWREMLNQGLTTWAEWSGPDSRSDCHAWGASPNFELLRTVSGIESAAPGFARVRITPNLGKLGGVTAAMPHPKGLIRVRLVQDGSQGKAAGSGEIELPAGITGEFAAWGKTQPLHPGKNRVGG